ncbi:hypothetical protein ATCC90586_003884 [Pythium insidiosum]|nr:hypothetical protein ATCC90586_003884 [Pythium insidiosum]
MQSLHAARALLNALAVLCAWRAAASSSWAVVEPSAPSTSSDHAVALSFAPTEFCLHFANGSSVCEEYAVQLSRLGETSARPSPQRVSAVLDDSLVVAATTETRVHAAVDAWCRTTDRRGHRTSSWVLQGAEAMLCLVVLETCVYTRALALLFGAAGVVLALATLRGHSRLERGVAFCTYAQLTLQALVAVAWWAYTSSLVDLPLLSMLQLGVRLGAGLRLTVAAALLSLASGRLSLELSGVLARSHLGQIHQDPCLVSLHAPSTTSSFSSSSSSSSTSSSSSSACLPSKPDPLRCPANYRV